MKAHPCKALVCRPGRQTGDTIFRAQARRLIVKGDMVHSVELLLDVKRCLDQVDRAQYAEIVERVGYTRLAASYSIQMNAMPRRLLWDGDLVGEVINTRNGQAQPLPCGTLTCTCWRLARGFSYGGRSSSSPYTLMTLGSVVQASSCQPSCSSSPRLGLGLLWNSSRD